MNAEQFRKGAEVNETLRMYLDEVEQDADPDNGERSFALSALFSVAAYALYRLAKNYFDLQRGLDEAELRQAMLQEVEHLVQNGWGRDKALAAVQKVSKDIATLRPDSPALNAALALLKGAAAGKG